MKRIFTGVFIVIFVTSMMFVVSCGGPQGGTQISQQPTEKPVEQPMEEPTEAPAEPEEEAVAAAPLSNQSWDAWFRDRTEWVGSISEFKFDTEDSIKPADDPALKVSTKIGDDLIRDVLLARYVDGLEAGKTYKVSVDYRFDVDAKEKSYVQYFVKDGNQQSQEAILEIEDYPLRKVPETKYLDASTFGDGSFHTLEFEHTVGAGESSLSLMMIVRFQTTKAANNVFYFGNFKCEAK